MPREIITLQCGDCKERNYFIHQESKDYDGAAGAEKVLPRLPQAHAA